MSQVTRISTSECLDQRGIAEAIQLCQLANFSGWHSFRGTRSDLPTYPTSSGIGI